MSARHVEMVRQAFQAEARRDRRAIIDLYAPDVVMDFSESPFADFLPQGVFTGIDEIQDAFRDWYQAWDQVDTDVTDVAAVGDHVVTVFTYRGRGRASGVDVEWKDMAGLWTFRDDRIVRVAWLGNRQQALDAIAAT